MALGVGIAMDARTIRRYAEAAYSDDDLLPRGTPGRSTVTSRMSPGLVLRVSDPETARALGDALRGRDSNGVARDAEHSLAAAEGSSGAALRGDLRERFEGSLGADLSGVRVHTGGASADAAHAVGAKAYTVGNDIHFAAGQYQPDDPFGMHLIAHEVAHTVQQSGGATQRQHKLEVTTPGDAAEVEADRAADAMVSGQAFAISGAAPSIARAPAVKEAPASAEVTQTSVSLSAGPVSGKIDWEKPPPKGSIKLETELKKLPQFSRQIELVSFKKIVGAALEFRLDPTLKANASLTASGSFEAGKGGQINLVEGGGAVECGLTGTGRLIGFGGVAGEANVNAGFFAKIESKTTGSVTVKNGTWPLAGDGKPTGGATVIEGDVVAEATGSWGMDAGTYVDKKAATFASLEIGKKPLGKVSGLGFKVTINADGSVAPVEWKTNPVWEPPSLSLSERSVRKLTPEEKKQYQIEDAQQAEDRDGGSGSGAGVPPEAYDEEPEAEQEESFDEMCKEEDASVMCGSGEG